MTNTTNDKAREWREVLQMVLDGRISGRISEWPQLRPAIEAALAQPGGQGEVVADESFWRKAWIVERERHYRRDGLKIEQAAIHAQADAAMAPPHAYTATQPGAGGAVPDNRRAAVVVDEALTDKALIAYKIRLGYWRATAAGALSHDAQVRDAMRAALTAALGGSDA